MKGQVLVCLPLGVMLSGCFGNNDGADRSEVDSTPTRPQDRTIDDAQVIVASAT